MKKYKSFGILLLCLVNFTTTNSITNKQIELFSMICKGTDSHEIERFIVSRKIDVNFLGWYKNPKGKYIFNAVSPLQLAAKKLDFDLIDVLLRTGANINVEGRIGMSALHLFAESMFLTFSDENYRKKNFSDLQFCNNCCKTIFKILNAINLSNCFDLDSHKKTFLDYIDNEYIPLHLRVEIKGIVCNRFSAICNLNEEQNLLLMLIEKKLASAEKESLETKLLLKDVLCDLEIGYFKNLLKTYQQLKHVSIQDIFRMIRSHKEATSKIIKLIEQNDIDVNSKNQNNESLLFAAADTGSVTLVKYLLGKGAIVDECNEEKQTPLHRAIIRIKNNRDYQSFISIIRLLLHYHGNKNLCDSSGRTPLDYVGELKQIDPTKYYKLSSPLFFNLV